MRPSITRTTVMLIALDSVKDQMEADHEAPQSGSQDRNAPDR